LTLDPWYKKNICALRSVVCPLSTAKELQGQGQTRSQAEKDKDTRVKYIQVMQNEVFL